jgi:hypothetical protein
MTRAGVEIKVDQIFGNPYLSLFTLLHPVQHSFLLLLIFYSSLIFSTDHKLGSDSYGKSAPALSP